MIERLKAIEKRYNEIAEELSSKEVLSDIKKTTVLSKEQASLKEAYEAYQTYKKIEEDLKEANELLSDSELGEFAKEEVNRLSLEKEQLEASLEIILLPKDPNDGKNVIVEIRGAAGGDEANIFAGDLYRMYTYYAEKNGCHYRYPFGRSAVRGGLPPRAGL